MNYTAARHAALPPRGEMIAALQARSFDVVVIGGGITGAGIALDAATRGLTVALVEKGDYASGTSSKSTKLIHGGLRYLKQLDVALVREVGQERAAVHRLAPHLVQPEKMFIPIIEDGQMGRLTTSLALWVYDKLAGVDGEDQRYMLDREEALAAEPMLDPTRVEGGAMYAEYRTDDARLTIENLKTAAALGAVCANYAEVTTLIHGDDGRVAGVTVRDGLGDDSFDVHGAVVINAAGPWVDFIREIDRSLEGKRVFHAKGVHFVVPRERFPVRQSIYFDLPDGRMCFAIPRDRATYFGTTDTPFEADPNQVTPDGDDLAYLLHGVNAMFPELDLRADEIESSWAGLRPLIYEPGKSASEMSRRDEIFESESGLLSIAGGKLTGYRKMSERIMDKVVRRLGRGGATATAETALGGNDFHDFSYVVAYRAEVRADARRGRFADRARQLPRPPLRRAGAAGFGDSRRQHRRSGTQVADGRARLRHRVRTGAAAGRLRGPAHGPPVLRQSARRRVPVAAHGPLRRGHRAERRGGGGTTAQPAGPVPRARHFRARRSGDGLALRAFGGIIAT